MDDAPDLPGWLRYSRREHGYAVHAARKGLQALHRARRFLPDLILLDLMREGRDGLTA